MWRLRYWLSRWLLSLSLFVMPRCPYRTELRRRIYDFRNEVTLDAILSD